MCVRTHIKGLGLKNFLQRYAACVRTHGDDAPSQTPAIRAWGGVLQVYARLVPIIDAELQVAAGISLTWYDLLLELNAATDRRLTMSELGERVVLSRSRVSRVVDELDAAGLVQREPHPQDRRSAYAVLTPAGRRRLRSAAPHYLAAIEEHFGRHLSKTELETVGRSLWRVHEAEKHVLML